MAAVRGRDTKPELVVRQLLHAAGMRYRVNLRIDLADVRVRPDIVFTRAKVAVFVDGCFWHRCPMHRTEPKTNEAFWKAKLDANEARDRLQDTALGGAGWTVVRAWEHEDPEAVATRIEGVVRGA